MFGNTVNKSTTGGLFGGAPTSGGLFSASGVNSSVTNQPVSDSTSGSKPATSQSQSGGLFGTTQASTGGLFGQTAATSQPQSSGIFSTVTSNPSSTTGLFGNATTQPAQTTGLFGSTSATTQPAQTTGLFGSTSATSQPAQTTGLFGSTTATSQPAQTTGLFGSTSAISQPTQTTGLFGPKTTTSQPAQTTGLFGSTSVSSQPQQSSGGLFGQTTHNQNQPATNLFGNLGSQNKQSQPQQKNTSSDLSGNNGITQGLQSNQQQTVPGVLIDVSNIRGTTRFNDLQEDLRKQIMEIDTMIQSQIQLKNDCDAIMPAHDSQLSQIPIDVEFCQRKLIGVDNAADSDIHAISAVQKLIKSDAKAAKLSFAAIDILRLPPQYHMSGVWPPKTNSRSNGEAGDIVEFFSQTADEMSTKLAMYHKHISEIEQHLRGVEANSAHQLSLLVAKKNGNSSIEESSFDQLAGVLRDFETGLLNVAGKVGATRKGVTALQLNQLSSPISNPRN